MLYNTLQRGECCKIDQNIGSYKLESTLIVGKSESILSGGSLVLGSMAGGWLWEDDDSFMQHWSPLFPAPVQSTASLELSNWGDLEVL